MPRVPRADPSPSVIHCRPTQYPWALSLPKVADPGQGDQPIGPEIPPNGDYRGRHPLAKVYGAGMDSDELRASLLLARSHRPGSQRNRT